MAHRSRLGRAASLGVLSWWTLSAAAAGSLPDLVEAEQRAAALELIDSGADVNERAADGSTALLWAASQSDVGLIEQLLARGADPKLPNNYGVTPLAAAAVEGNYGVVKALLDAGADVESANSEGQTVLMVVARTGHVDTAQLLLDRGANVNAIEKWGGQSALMWAASEQQPEMARLLIEHGADVNARGIAHDWQRKVTAEPRIKIMHTGGFTPLLYAAREGCLACVQALAAGHADLDLSDPFGVTPLLMALLNRHFDVAGALIEAGADVDRWDWWGRAPLWVAIELNAIPDSRRGDLPVLDRLTGHDIARMAIERGANVDMQIKQQPPMRKEPSDRGYNDGNPDALIVNTGATPLLLAAKLSDNEMVELLLEHHANVSLPNVFGITPFMAAAGVGHWWGLFFDYPTLGRYKTGADAVATMKLLIAANADTRARSKAISLGRDYPVQTGFTPAHGAAFEGWPEAIQFLHDVGADINAKMTSKDGATPRDLAVAKGNAETVALIDKLLAADAGKQGGQ
jgi:ankyrin repeat protein